jgi:hypothetical protein
LRENRQSEFEMACRGVGLQLLIVKAARGRVRFQFYMITTANVRSKRPIYIASGSSAAINFFHGWSIMRTIVLAMLNKGKSEDDIRRMIGAPKPQ